MSEASRKTDLVDRHPLMGFFVLFMKDNFWFKHTSNAGRGNRMLKMTHIYGHWGKGVYWDVIEVLREQSNYEYPKDEESLHMFCTLIGLKGDESKFVNWYRDCIKLELFLERENHFFSPVLCENMQDWETRKANGKKGGRPRKTDNYEYEKTESKPKDNLNHKLNESKTKAKQKNKIREDNIREKEIKEKDLDFPDEKSVGLTFGKVSPEEKFWEEYQDFAKHVSEKTGHRRTPKKDNLFKNFKARRKEFSLNQMKWLVGRVAGDEWWRKSRGLEHAHLQYFTQVSSYQKYPPPANEGDLQEKEKIKQTYHGGMGWEPGKIQGWELLVEGSDFTMNDHGSRDFTDEGRAKLARNQKRKEDFYSTPFVVQMEETEVVINTPIQRNFDQLPDDPFAEN